MGQFGVSQPVRRREDPRLLAGRGCFIDDLSAENMARGHVLRSPHASAKIRSIDTQAATAAPGVLAVVTGADLAADGVGAIPCLVAPAVRKGTKFIPHVQSALAGDAVRYVGDPVVFIVAETLDQARDAAELIAIDYDPGPAATECGAVAPLVWEDAPDNVCFDWELGDGPATDAALKQAERIVTIEIVNNRIILNAIETRGALGAWDQAAGKFTLRTGSQMPHSVRDQLARDIFGLEPEDVRVVVDDVGGGFGGKNSLYPEQILVLHAARRLGRPVKWVGERTDAFVSDYHGRDNVSRGALALDKDGIFLGLKVTTFANLGAYTANRGTLSPTVGVMLISNAYRIPAIHVGVKGVYTHTTPTDPYRGAGRPEAIYLIERLIDAAARELGIDRVELRRRNFIPPDAFPYETPTGLSYDSADFTAVLDDALKRADWAGAVARRKAAAKNGRLRGIGLAVLIERCGGGAGLAETAKLVFDEKGTVELLIGSMSNGQGHETAYSQIINDALGLPFEQIRIVQGDTDRVATGLGTGGSWSIPMGGGAVRLAADKILEKARRLAAHLIEAAEADLKFAEGTFTVAGTDMRIALDEVARAAHDPARLPDGEAPGLDGEVRFQPDNYTFPYGCHVAEVEIDGETGAVELISYVAVHDFGRALNPLLLEGQVTGGVVQGLGQALTEHTIYDQSGQLLSGSFVDYCLPRADDVPGVEFAHVDTPTARNPLSIKGCGEAGAAASPPALINAVIDALAPLGVDHIDMPATPGRVWRAIQAARRTAR